MKHLKQFILLGWAIFASSCSKDKTTTSSLASVNVVNVATGIPSVKVNYFGNDISYSKYTDIVAFGANKVYTIDAAAPARLAIVSTGDTLHPVYDRVLNLEPQAVYSVYLAGQASIDTLFFKDDIPVHPDSTMGVRFINLSPNSGPVSITLSASPGTNEFSGLGYEQLSGFKSYAALSSTGNYIFQVRDAVTNSLLVTYTLATPRFFNVTLVLKGLVGGSGTTALGIYRVNNY